MDTSVKKTARVAVIVFMVFVMPSMLQAEVLPSNGPIPFASYDANSDGIIEKAEFENVRSKRMQEKAEAGRPMRNAANAPEFSEFDANGDGKLTSEELQAGQNARMQQRGGRGMGRGN
jgi:hypothetical protein